jgi:hypothetical protein
MTRLLSMSFLKTCLSMSFLRTYAAWLALPFLGFLFGVLATSANPIIIGMAGSSFIGIVLLSKPTWTVDLVVVLGLFVGGLAVLFIEDLDKASKLVWGISILGFVLLFLSFYKLLTDPQATKSTPTFIWIALVFIIYSMIDSGLQFYSASESIGGFKRYFQVWGLMFALCWLGFSKKEIERWSKMVLFICLLQAPFCLHQLLVLVPILEGEMEGHAELVPIDVVAGTFGADMYGGGNNAEMATAVVMVFGFLLGRFNAKVMSGKKLFWISLLLLSPLVMGETKIIVFYFPLFMLILYRKELINRPFYAVVALVCSGVFMLITLNVYMIMTKMGLDQLIYDTLLYNVYELGYGNCVLNRTTVLTFWWSHQSLADPLSFIFGNGLGSAREGSGDSGNGHLDLRYPGYCVGFTGVSMLLWELGVFGFTLYMWIMVSAWRCANRLMAQSADPVVRADTAAIQGSIALFATFPLYQNTLLSEFSFQFMYMSMLGYLAWMYKQQAEKKHE